jgi:hypothetical protein
VVTSGRVFNGRLTPKSKSQPVKQLSRNRLENIPNPFKLTKLKCGKICEAKATLQLALVAETFLSFKAAWAVL